MTYQNFSGEFSERGWDNLLQDISMKGQLSAGSNESKQFASGQTIAGWGIFWEDGNFQRQYPYYWILIY